jgi:hypothetical protein
MERIIGILSENDKIRNNNVANIAKALSVHEFIQIELPAKVRKGGKH